MKITLPENGGLKWESVPILEFGVDPETNEPLEVDVRGLTIAEWTERRNKLLRIEAIGVGQAPKVRLAADFDDVAWVAAVTAHDEDGDRVFGETVDEAYNRVRGLSRLYMPAIRRIHRKALELSGQKWVEGAAPSDEMALEAAEKN